MPPFAAALALTLAAAQTAAPPADAGQRTGSAPADVAARACHALGARVAASAGEGPVLLRSYDAGDGGAPDAPALRTAAFSYDNAAAAIALIACGDLPHARRIGAALRLAASAGPVRNAYRAGAAAAAPLPNGWWDANANQWREDAYQDGSASGSAAWVGLALVQLGAASGDATWFDAAAALAQGIDARSRETTGAGGYSGGTLGFDAAPQRVSWRSSEHNIDLYALFAALAVHTHDDAWRQRAAHARHFVAAQWDASSGHFWIGTQPDGVATNFDTSGLDVQLWAQLVPDAAPEWRRAVAYAERAHGVDGGFDFNTDRDGAWLEGTAQAALVYRRSGRSPDAARLFATLAANLAPDGMVYATREARVSTGLAAGAAAAADFYYYRWPHVAATAWSALAATDFDPFMAGGGRR